jgi:hypothetical protein
MPRTELASTQPDGSPHWVEWSSNWKSGVRFHVKAAVEYRTEAVPGASKVVQISDGANDDRQRLALWAQQITAWSFSEQGIPVPSQNVAGPEVVWDTLDGPDFNLLADATQELLDAVTASPTRGRSSAKDSSTT